MLVVQLGTPTAPEPGPVRRYLAQFLADPRVVEIPPVLWKLILHGIILRTRPAKSAKKYESIWTKEGSPLMANTQRQARLLRGYLGEAGHDVEVEFAMRYGKPSIGAVLVPLSPLLMPSGLTSLLRDSGANCLVTQRSMAPMIDQVRAELPELAADHVLMVDGPAGDYPDYGSLLLSIICKT